MKSILFIIYPFPSHYYPAFAFAKEWQMKGYNVVFTGNSQKLQKIVSDEGFVFCPFDSGEEYKISSFKSFLGLLIKTVFDKSFLKKRYREFYQLQIDSTQLKKIFNPEIIYLDEHLSYFYPFLMDNIIEVIALNPMLSATKKRGIPPLNSSLLATNTFLKNLQCEFLWFLHLTKLSFIELKQKIAFMGKGDVYFLERMLRKKGFAYHEIIDKNHSFYRGIKNIKTVLIAPQELEYEFVQRSPNETYHLTPIIRNETAYITPEYIRLVEYINEKKSLSNQKIICCSFGTLTEFNEKRVKRFFFDVLSKIDDPNLLIVISTKIISEQEFNVPNIRILPFLPHLDFLKYIDVMITHGGLGTIKECLQANRKMIIYPIIKEIDQPGNAIRVQHKNFGLMGDLDKETTEGLRIKIRHLIIEKANTLNPLEVIK
jgi:zeaxanthin glucosyltransferase